MKFLKKSVFFFFIAFILSAFSFKNRQGNTLKPLCKKVKFEEVCKGNYCGITDRKNQVIKTQEDWNKLWEKTYSIQTPKPKLPKIDFNKEMIIGIYSGEHNSGGYDVEITEIKKHKGEINVSFFYVAPGPTCEVTSALTQPYCFIRLKKSNKNILFKGYEGTRDCE